MAAALYECTGVDAPRLSFGFDGQIAHLGLGHGVYLAAYERADDGIRHLSDGCLLITLESDVSVRIDASTGKGIFVLHEVYRSRQLVAVHVQRNFAVHVAHGRRDNHIVLIISHLTGLLRFSLGGVNDDALRVNVQRIGCHVRAAAAAGSVDAQQLAQVAAEDLALVFVGQRLIAILPL